MRHLNHTSKKFWDWARISSLSLIFILFAEKVAATNYYVNDNSTSGDSWCTAVGNNANNGTAINTPKRNVSNIISSYGLTAGDVVYVDKGSYSEQVTITSSDDGSGGSYVTFLGAGTGNTTITYNSYQTVYLNGASAKVQYVKFQDITLDNTSTGTNYDLPLWLYGDADNNVFDNVIFTSSGATSNAITLNGDCDNNEFSDCTMTNSPSSGSDHFTFWIVSNPSYGAFSGNSVHDCTIHNTGSVGNAVVYVWDRDGTGSTGGSFYNNTVESDDVTIDCITYANVTAGSIYKNQILGGRYGLYLYGDAAYDAGHSVYDNYFATSRTSVYSYYVQDVDFYHNSIYSTRYGIYAATTTGMQSWNIVNNIFYTTGNSSYAALYLPTATSAYYPVSCDYNLYYLPGGAHYAWKNGVSYSTMATWRATDHVNGAASGDENSVSGNPNYNDPSNGDLVITSGSAANNKGTTVASVTTDINSVTWGTYRNIGAYEDAGALPIVLKNFSVKCNDSGIDIDWVTASEVNCDFFTIEKSTDGINSTEVAKVKGAINSNQTNYYTATDNNYTTEHPIYYRLTQTDLDGAVNIFNWVPVQCNVENTFVVDIYPNPAIDQLTCQTINSVNENASLNIHNALGELVVTRNQALQKGTNIFIVGVQDLPSGVYILQLRWSSRMISHKFVKL
jgi:hypothetical protein